MSITMSDRNGPLEKLGYEGKHGFPIFEDSSELRVTFSEIPEIFIIDNGPICQIDLISFDG